MLVLSGCDRRETQETAPASAFRHELSGDVSGEYRPVGEGAGPWRVESLFVGQASAFLTWEAGGRSAAPLILTLTGPDGTVRVTPDAYVVTDDSLRFSGRAANGDKVTVQARLDQGALATARRNLGDQTPVITGAASVAGQGVPFSLARWGGD
ncbi:hypothetical protein [Brevundimonas sp. SORGH_AS_0993]|uniref:hypothetical protein n=1 Tax=Brevundimonas sp. SORGH_AS_0993 TaxID=3041794 RepID=UPI002780C36C|nr:hypothetical protein [Brevundimonas sp. SORGH_AS_0993]MDQ1153142.1 uncharacterized protein (UPF0262 family) [Brevundimonas sp. SORGH_AS_0993]